MIKQKKAPSRNQDSSYKWDSIQRYNIFLNPDSKDETARTYRFCVLKIVFWSVVKLTYYMWGYVFGDLIWLSKKIWLGTLWFVLNWRQRFSMTRLSMTRLSMTRKLTRGLLCCSKGCLPWLSDLETFKKYSQRVDSIFVAV